MAVEVRRRRQYIVWNTDGGGNWTGHATGVVSGSDYAIQFLEMDFQQDLNGDGQTGPTTTTIETAGVTDLVQAGNQYFLGDGDGAGLSVEVRRR